MKLKLLIYPLRILYILLIAVGICTIPVLTVVMVLTPILDIFCYIATGRFQLTECFCDWYFSKYLYYYPIYLKPENILEKIENKCK